MNTAVAASTPQQRAPHQAQLCGRVADPGQPYVPPRGRHCAVSRASGSIVVSAAARTASREPAARRVSRECVTRGETRAGRRTQQPAPAEKRQDETCRRYYAICDAEGGRVWQTKRNG